MSQLDNDKSPNMKWNESLQKKSKKVKKKDLKKMMKELAGRVKSSTALGNQWRVVGLNFANSEVYLVNKDEDACMSDLATLNGFTVE